VGTPIRSLEASNQPSPSFCSFSHPYVPLLITAVFVDGRAFHLSLSPPPNGLFYASEDSSLHTTSFFFFTSFFFVVFLLGWPSHGTLPRFSLHVLNESSLFAGPVYPCYIPRVSQDWKYVWSTTPVGISNCTGAFCGWETASFSGLFRRFCHTQPAPGSFPPQMRARRLPLHPLPLYLDLSPAISFVPGLFLWP